MERHGALRTTAVCVVAAAAVQLAPAAEAAEAMKHDANDFPHLWITNGPIRLKLYLPAGEKGYYVGSRFDASGVVGRAEYKGHSFFGPWQRRDPKTHDHIMGTAEEFSMFSPPGFEEVQAGGVFYKIGVGELVRKEAPVKDKKTGKMEPQPYAFHGCHEIARRGEWKVTHGKDWVQFVQDFEGQRGWAWHYTKRVSLVQGLPSFTISRRLENTGTKLIDTTHYCHHFTIIDDEPIGPDYRVHLAFEARAKELKGAGAEVKDRQIVLLRPLGPGQSVWADLTGMRGTALDNAAVIENRKTRARLKITGDRPVVLYRFWATHRAACPEPFVAVKLVPHLAMTWQNTYTFEVGGAAGAK
jgi:hypothetical protein